MYPYASLPGNLAAFCGALRRAHGFHIGPAELADAARALGVVPLGDRDRVRDALRLVLSGRVEDVEIFDLAFDEFFFPSRAGVRQEGLPSIETPLPDEQPALSGSTERSGAERSDPGGERLHDGEDEEAPDGTAAGAGGDDLDESSAMLRARASRSVAAGQGPVLARPDEAWRDAARALVRRVRLGQARRWRSAPRGVRFDLRRTLRASLHTGGEALTPRWLARPRRTARFVVLIDGSRSMHDCGDAPLRLASALATVTTRVEVFAFSTTLRRVTTAIRASSAGAQALAGLEAAWGGGTTIGACLRELLRTAGDRLLARDTCVIIASDGLDAGDPVVLGEAMHDIDRRSAGIVWLNPLLGSPGYEPTATGMRLALPHVATFARVTTASELEQLSSHLRLLR